MDKTIIISSWDLITNQYRASVPLAFFHSIGMIVSFVIIICLIYLMIKGIRSYIKWMVRKVIEDNVKEKCLK